MHLFPVDFLVNDASEEDLKISRLLVTLWTNFATTGWVPTEAKLTIVFLCKKIQIPY